MVQQHNENRITSKYNTMNNNDNDVNMFIRNRYKYIKYIYSDIYRIEKQYYIMLSILYIYEVYMCKYILLYGVLSFENAHMYTYTRWRMYVCTYERTIRYIYVNRVN